MELTRAQAGWFDCNLRGESSKPGAWWWGNKGAPRLQVMGSTEGARSELEFHAAAPVRKGGERSWSWAAVSLSMTTMGPPHLGQRQSGRGSLAAEASGSGLRWLDCVE